MPDWPAYAPVARRPVIYTNVTEWVRRTGRVPDYTSATFVMPANGANRTPIYIPVPMTVERLYVANGASVAGNCRMSLVGSTPGGEAGSAFPDGTAVIQSGIEAQAGTSIWQVFEVPSRLIAAGLYWITYVSSLSTGTVQRLFAPLGASTGEAAAGGLVSGARFPETGGVLAGGLSIVTPVMAVGGLAHA